VFFGNESLNFNHIDRAKSETLLTTFERQQRLIALLLVGLRRFGNSRPGAEHRHQHPVDLADLAAEPAADYWGTARHQRSDFANLTENSPFCVEARRGLERAVQKGEFLTLRRCTML